ncbi:MAG: tetratricopeptide repeat protein [Ktedonobacteraceae bacterium]
MQIQQNEPHPDKPQDHHRLPLGPISFVLIVLLSIAVIATIWLYLGTDAGIFCTFLFVVFSVVFAFLQLTPPLFSKNTEPSTAPHIIIRTSPSQHDLTTVAPSSNQNIVDATISSIDQPSGTKLSSRLESASSIWNVPYHRNPFFTGREDLLKQLHEYFMQAKTAALKQPPTITGLGGIGKTQTAIEYAYRYKDTYHSIFWVNATSRETLIEGFINIALLLALPTKNERDQNITVTIVHQWLANHTDWLLIMDNADDSTLVTEFLPPRDNGHILLTTREPAWGSVARSFAVEKMDEIEGMLFLLRRAKILTSPSTPLSEASRADQVKAAAIVKAMDGLPLALDQAGAYIEETPSTLDAYLKAYQRRQTELLQERGNDRHSHPDPVATTWSLNFEQVEQLNPSAADLLRFLAFLAPDAIPEEMIIAGASELSPQLQALATDDTLLDQPLKILHGFSLVQRNTDKRLLFIHRLVQAVLKTQMTDQAQHAWAEHTVRAVDQAFPDVTDIEAWEQCERLLPHALACAELINEYTFALPEAARLLNQTGDYLDDHAQYEQAKSLLERALAIHEQVLGPNHPETALNLNNLAALYYNQGNYERAKPLLERALAIHEQVLGPNHPTTATCLNNLAVLYDDQGDYEHAKPLYERALAFRPYVLGPNHPTTATSLNNLAFLHNNQGDYEQAKLLYERALAIHEQVLGSNHPTTATSLNNLAALYYNQGDYEQAKPLYKRALAIREHVLGSNHPETALSLNNLAALYYNQGNYERAKPLYERALAIREQVLGPNHPTTATSLNNLAVIYDSQGDYERAKPLLERALAIHEQVLGPNHPTTALSLNNLAALYDDQGDYKRAKPLYEQALTIREQVFGPNHPETALSLNNLAFLYNNQGDYEQAKPLYERALAIMEKTLGSNHPYTKIVRENHASLLEDMEQKEKK